MSSQQESIEAITNRIGVENHHIKVDENDLVTVRESVNPREQMTFGKDIIKDDETEITK